MEHGFAKLKLEFTLGMRVLANGELSNHANRCLNVASLRKEIEGTLKLTCNTHMAC